MSCDMFGSSNDIPTVLLWLDLSTDFSRQLARGVHDYAQERGPWNLVAELPSDLRLSASGRLPPMRWEGIDGVIVRLLHDRVGRALRRFDGPRVILAGYYSGLRVPRIVGDSASAVRLIIDHLRERGYRHLAYCGFSGLPLSAMREKHFMAAADQQSMDAHVYRSGRRGPESQVADQKKLIAWLEALPKPVGIMAMNDVRGRHVTEACKLADIDVPQDVGVIGVDNEQLLCELSDPPLSSVDMNSYQIGREGAAVLDVMMQRGRARKPINIRPAGVVARGSTNRIVTDDELVALAAGYIEQHVRQGINVDDVLDFVRVSRSNLERRFTASLDCTPRQYIERVRLELARQLLTSSDQTIVEVAEAVGYRDVRRLHEALQRSDGRTPGQVRRGRG